MSLISKNKNFRVYKSLYLSNDDIKILTLLYLPIIESYAFSFYMYLYNLVDFNKGCSELEEIIYLEKCLNINWEKINENKNKLEAVGLLKTYEIIKDDSIAFELFSPLSSKDFIENKGYSDYFENLIGQKEYLNITKKFVKENIPNNKIDITNSNPSILYLTDLDKKSKYVKYIKQELKNNTDITYSFDPNLFINLLKENNVYLDLESLDDDNYINDLKELAFINNIDEKTMANIFKQTAVRDKKYPNKSDLQTKIFLFLDNKINTLSNKELIKTLESFDFEKLKNYIIGKTNIKQFSKTEDNEMRLFYAKFSNNYPKAYLYLTIYYALISRKDKKIAPNSLYYEKVLHSLITKYNPKNSDEFFELINRLTDEKNKKTNTYNNKQLNNYDKIEEEKFLKRIKKDDISRDDFLKKYGIDPNNLRKEK